MRRLSAILALGLLFTVLPGCGDSADEDSPVATPPSEITAPPPVVTAASDAKTPAQQPETLPQGPFTSTTFAPGLTLTLPDDRWHLAADSATEFVLERGEERGSDWAFVGFFRVRQVRSQSNFSTPEPLPSDLIAWLTTHRDLTVRSGPTAVDVDGVQGTQVDVETDASYDVPLFDGFELHYRDAVRFIALQINGDQVLISGGTDVPIDFAPFAAEVLEPMMASVDLP